MTDRPIDVLTRPFAPVAGPAIPVFLTSATILFAELLLIRPVPADVVYTGDVSTFSWS